MEAALDGEAPGMVNGRGAVTAVTEQRRASRPRGVEGLCELTGGRRQTRQVGPAWQRLIARTRASWSDAMLAVGFQMDGVD